MQVDITQWDLRNMWKNQSNELITRPGYDELCLIKADGSTGANLIPRAGFSVKSQFVDSIQHYVLVGRQDTGTLELRILNENMDVDAPRQILQMGSDRRIRALGYAVIGGEIVIAGPDIPTLWGYTGSGIAVAKKQNTINVTMETMGIPQGLCTAWADRCVIAVREAIFISDPYAPRTYTTTGFITMPGVVYGLHASPDGSLTIVTADGVYSLSAQSAATGAGISGSIEKLSNYQASDYNQSALTPHGLYGLSQRGVKRIDVDSSPEMTLSDKSYVRSLSDMISYPDYRSGSLYRTSSGLAVTVGTMDADDDTHYEGGVCMIDFDGGIKSWWTMESMRRMVGVMHEREGDDVFLMTQRASLATLFAGFYKFHLDRDNLPGNQEYYGSMSGLVPNNPETSPVVRAVYMKADNGGNLVKVAVRGEYRKKNGTNQQIITDPNGVIVGSAASPQDIWTNDPAGKRVKTRELESNRFQFAKRTDDISIEVAAQSGRVRVGSVDMETAGYGSRRPI